MKDLPVAFLGGPMTGYPEFNFPAFFAAEDALTRLGYNVFSPAKRDVEDGFHWKGKKGTRDELVSEGFLPGLAMAENLKIILLLAEIVVFLPGWHQSKGCAVELAAARYVKKPVYELENGQLCALTQGYVMSRLPQEGALAVFPYVG